MFSLDHDGLRAGGETLAAADANADTALLSAGSGLADVLAERDALVAEADALWSPERLAEPSLLPGRSPAESRRRRYPRTRGHGRRLAQQARSLRGRRSALPGTGRTAPRAQPSMARTRTHPARGPAGPSLSRDRGRAGRARRHTRPAYRRPHDLRAGQRDDRIGRRRDRLHRRPDRAHRCRNRHAHRRPGTARGRRGHRASGRTARPDRCRSRTRRRDRRANRRISPMPSPTHAANSAGPTTTSEWPTAAALAQARRLAAAEATHRQSLEHATDNLNTARETDARLAAEADALGGAADTTALEAWLAACTREGDLESEWRNAQAGVDRLERDLARRLAAMQPAVADIETLATLHVPTRDRVDEFEAAIDGAREAQQTASDAHRRTHRRSRSRARCAGPSPRRRSPAQRRKPGRDPRKTRCLLAARAASLCRTTRARSVRRQPMPQTGCRRRKEPGRNLRAHHARGRRAGRCPLRPCRSHRPGRSNDSAMSPSANRRWNRPSPAATTPGHGSTACRPNGAALWASAELEPASPAAMRDWLDRRDAALDARADRIDAEASRDDLAERIAAHRDHARRYLVALGVDESQIADASLAVLIEHARRLVEREHRKRDDRQRLDRERGEQARRIEALQASCEQAEAALRRLATRLAGRAQRTGAGHIAGCRGRPGRARRDRNRPRTRPPGTRAGRRTAGSRRTPIALRGRTRSYSRGHRPQRRRRRTGRADRAAIDGRPARHSLAARTPADPQSRSGRPSRAYRPVRTDARRRRTPARRAVSPGRRRRSRRAGSDHRPRRTTSDVDRRTRRHRRNACRARRRPVDRGSHRRGRGERSRHPARTDRRPVRSDRQPGRRPRPRARRPQRSQGRVRRHRRRRSRRHRGRRTPDRPGRHAGCRRALSARRPGRSVAEMGRPALCDGQAAPADRTRLGAHEPAHRRLFRTAGRRIRRRATNCRSWACAPTAHASPPSA